MLLNLENVQFLQLLSAAVGQHFGDRAAAVHLPAILTQPDSDSTGTGYLNRLTLSSVMISAHCPGSRRQHKPSRPSETLCLR